ncbi:MAG: crossover junction endodeoxyribonuclease RuvC [Bdellovibrionales bacterium]|nr:crossover junction endodeoxyribonuclease RuvC [Bdellovibrionales bacterium]
MTPSPRIRILGIDPGSRLTGYGIIEVFGNSIRVITHGTLKLSSTSGRSTIPLEQRLLSIFTGLSEVIQKHHPHVMAIEKVFFAKNAVSALKLGQARGVAILSGAYHGLEIHEYSATEVKSMIVGQGHADKNQVAKMIQLLTGQKEFDTSDASDGLALALCHAYRLRSLPAVARKTSQGQEKSAAQVLAEAQAQASSGKRKKRWSLAESVGIVQAATSTKRSRHGP